MKIHNNWSESRRPGGDGRGQTLKTSVVAAPTHLRMEPKRSDNSRYVMMMMMMSHWDTQRLDEDNLDGDSGLPLLDLRFLLRLSGLNFLFVGSTMVLVMVSVVLVLGVKSRLVPA